MAFQGISTGTTPNDGTGDTLIDGAKKINSNFQEIYDALGNGTDLLTGNPNLTVGFITATGGSFSDDVDFSGNVSIAGTLTYEDVENIDSVGVVTARDGIVVSASGINVTGDSTFSNYVDLNSGLNVTGVATFATRVSIAESVYHTGDTDTHFGFSNDNTIVAFTSGQEAVRIDSGGNVGINSDNPTHRLEVYGTMNSTNVSVGDSIIHAGDTDTAIRFPSADTLTIETAGFERFRVNSSGNVTIGTGVTISSDGIEVDSQSTSLVIGSNTTFYVTTTGNDSTGDGSSGSPWATIGKAAEYLSERRIKKDVSVTVSVGSGTYTFTSNQKIAHPQGSQIEYVGATPTGSKPRGTTLNGNSGGSAVRGNTVASESSNDGDLKAYYNTVFQFNNCNAFVFGGLYVLNLKNILIRGNGGTLGNGQGADGITIQGSGGDGLGGSLKLNNCAIHNFSGRGVALVFGGHATLIDLTVTNCKGGVDNTSGVILGDTSSIGGTPTFTVSNCTNTGCSAQKCASTRIENSMISNNGINGVNCQEQSNIRMNKSTVGNNGELGVKVELNGQVIIRSGIVTDNGADGPKSSRQFGIRASSGSYVDYRSGGDLSSNTRESSPMLNTTGSSGAFIAD